MDKIIELLSKKSVDEAIKGDEPKISHPRYL